MSRLRACGLHLLLSAMVLGGVLCLMRLWWYPGDYFVAAGGDRLFLILAAVTLGLGPLLTLVVFRPGKWGLRFDLAVIACLQSAALACGITVMLAARPAFLVFVGDKFRIAAAGALEEARLAAARDPAWRRLPLDGPILVAARVPDAPELRAQVVFAAASLIDLDQFPEAYVPYAEARGEVLGVAQPLHALRAIAPGNWRVVDEFVQRSARPEQAYVFVPLLTPAGREMAVVLEAGTAAYQAILPAQAWR